MFFRFSKLIMFISLHNIVNYRYMEQCMITSHLKKHKWLQRVSLVIYIYILNKIYTLCLHAIQLFTLLLNIYLYIYTQACGPRHSLPHQTEKFPLIGYIVVVQGIVIYIYTRACGPLYLLMQQDEKFSRIGAFLLLKTLFYKYPGCLKHK